MATKAKKSSSPQKTAAPANAGKAEALKKDPKALNREINEALTDEERAGIFLSRHWKKLIAAAVLAVVAITAVFAVMKHRESARKAATAELAKANTVAEIEAAIAKNPDAPGVDAARFRLANQYENEKKYDKARQTLETLASATEDVANRSRAQLNAAYLFELEGKADDAVRKFSVLAQNTALPAAVRAEAAYSAARLYIDLKKPAEAKKVLDLLRVMKNNPAEQPGTALWLEKAAALENSIN